MRLIKAIEDMATTLIDVGAAHGDRFIVNMGEISFAALLSEVGPRWNPFEFERSPHTPTPDHLELCLAGKSLSCYRRGHGRSVEITALA